MTIVNNITKKNFTEAKKLIIDNLSNSVFTKLMDKKLEMCKEIKGK